MTPLAKITCIAVLTTLLIYGLVVGQDFLIPLVVAVAIWYFLVAMAKGIQKLSFGFFEIPYFLAFLGAILLFFGMGRLVFTIISSNIQDFIVEAPGYQQKFLSLYNKFIDFLGLDESPHLSLSLDGLDFVSLASTLLSVLTLIASNLGLIFIYVLFLVFEQNTFPAKMQWMLQDDKKHMSAKEVIDTIGTKMQSYVRIKTLLSIATGVASYFVMIAIGLDFAGFWAFLIFLFNYIPTIGSIIATILPCLFSILQFEAILPFLAVSIALTSIQFLIGNVIEPNLMGRSFDLSGLVILISLALWGKLWGIIGMFLCVPILVIVKIILDTFPDTKALAIFLSSGKKSS